MLFRISKLEVSFIRISKIRFENKTLKNSIFRIHPFPTLPSTLLEPIDFTFLVLENFESEKERKNFKDNP